MEPPSRRPLAFAAWPTVLAGLAVCACHKGAGDSGGVPPSAPAGSAPAIGRPPPGPRSIRLTPTGGIGFDDLLYSSELRTVLAPAGATGCVGMFDSSSLTQNPLCGLSAPGDYAGGHGEGVTSADVGSGHLFAIDRTSQRLEVADLSGRPPRPPAKGYPLIGQPDYVRWVASTREVWVTEPDQERIEVFAVGDSGNLSRTNVIVVKGGPESLVVDVTRGRAYSHLWSGYTVAIDLATHAIAQRFANGCKSSRGIALSAKQGFLFAGCSEGKAVVLDVDHAGKVLGTAQTPSGVDIIAANVELNHLYVPAASDGSVTVLGVRANGTLNRLGSLSAAPGAHCVASADHSRVWVCSPDAGALLVFEDTFPRTLE